MTDCHVLPINHEANEAELESASLIRLALSGLGCVNCAHRVRNALLSCPGVVNAEVNLGAAVADIWYRPDRIGPLSITKVVSRAGAGTHHRYRAVPAKSLFGAKQAQALG